MCIYSFSYFAFRQYDFDKLQTSTTIVEKKQPKIKCYVVHCGNCVRSSVRIRAQNPARTLEKNWGLVRSWKLPEKKYKNVPESEFFLTGSGGVVPDFGPKIPTVDLGKFGIFDKNLGIHITFLTNILQLNCVCKKTYEN